MNLFKQISNFAKYAVETVALTYDACKFLCGTSGSISQKDLMIGMNQLQEHGTDLVKDSDLNIVCQKEPAEVTVSQTSFRKRSRVKKEIADKIKSESFLTNQELATKYGVSKRTIERILHGRHFTQRS